MKSSPNIAVLLPNWVGDVVMATPSLRALREQFPRARITYVGRPLALDVLEECPWADRALPDVSRDRPRWRSFFRQISALRAGRFDQAVLLPNSFRTALQVWLAGIPRRVGYDRDARGWMLTDRCRPERRRGGGFRPISALDYYRRLVGLLGVRVDSRHMELPVRGDHRYG